MPNEVLTFNLVALTPIWTGGIKKNDNSKLRLTGIKGSLRWWYEALIRGLGAYACDPRPDSTKCAFDIKKIPQNDLTDSRHFAQRVKEQMCPACYMFGCTGWSGKFIIRIFDNDDNDDTPRDAQVLERKTPFQLRFIPMKDLDPIEDILIKKTVKLIVDYGAIGGRTVLKPSRIDYKNTTSYKDSTGRTREHHFDYGIVGRLFETGTDKSGLPEHDGKGWTMDVQSYSNQFKQHTNDEEWPDLRCFWFINNFVITGELHNNIVRRDPLNPKRYQNGTSPGDIYRWLGGDQGISKKIFSFHGIKNSAIIETVETAKATTTDHVAGVERSFGYAKRGEFEKVMLLIDKELGVLGDIKCGTEVLDEL